MIWARSLRLFFGTLLRPRAYPGDRKPLWGEPPVHHEIEWEFGGGGYVRGVLICNAPPDAECRLVPEVRCQCESYTVQRDAKGPFHQVEDYWCDAVRRDMSPGGECNIVLSLNQDTEGIYEGCSTNFVIARTPVRPLWTGDYYDWEPA